MNRGPAAPGAPSVRIAIACLAAALIATTGSIGLFEPTETRYAEIGREMVANGDWLVPRLNGVAHLHKPPLAYWATAAGLATGGTHEWSARLPATLASILTLLFTALAARRRFAALAPDAGLVVWMLGSCVLFAAIGRALAADPFLAAAVSAFWAFAPSPWAWAAIGLGALAKGPVVLVPTVLAVVVAAAFARRREMLRLLGPRGGWLLALAIALPWYTWLAARTPGLTAFWLGDQLLGRMAGTAHHRTGPPGYFVAVLLVGALPWTPALLAGLARSWARRREPACALALAWLLVPLALFSLAGSKLPAYLLPAFPAVALLTGAGLAPRSRSVTIAIACVMAAIAVGGALLASAGLARLAGLPDGTRVPLAPAAIATLACFGAGALAMLAGRITHAAAAVSLAACTLLVALAPFEARLLSPRPMARLLGELRAPGEPVVEVARLDAGLPFYLGETLRMYDVPREIALDPARARAPITSADTVRALAESGGRVWLFGFEPAMRALADELALDYESVATGSLGTLAVVQRRPAGD